MAPQKKTKSNDAIYDAKKSYVDRAKFAEAEFNEFEIYSKTPETVVLLLGSNENEILLRTLHHLDKYAKRDPRNAQILYNLKIAEIIVERKLHEHEELFIKRFALKLLAEVFLWSEAKFSDEFKQQCLNTIRSYYLQDNDIFILEYASLIILKIMDEPRIISVLQNDIELITEGIYKHLSNTTDPDILYNSYRVLIKMLHEGTSIERICNIEVFPFERVLSDINNEYLEIRKASLETLRELAFCESDFFLWKFCCKQFFEEWYRVIENAEWLETHVPALELCRRLMRHSKVAQLFFMQFLIRFNVFWNKTILRHEATYIFYELSMYPEAWQYMFDAGVVTQLRDRIKDMANVTYELCVSVVKLMNHGESFMSIMQSNPVPNFLSILKNDGKDWLTRGAAAEGLTTLCRRSLDNSKIALENNVSSTISGFLNSKYGDVPLEVFINILNLLNCFAKNEDIRTEIMTEELASSLLFAIKNSSRSAVLVSNLFNTASAYISTQLLQNQFFKKDYWSTILKYLKSPAIIMKTAVADFIMLTGKTRLFANPYIDEGILEHLLADDAALITCSSWSAAIESILSADLSLKFSVRGKLDFTDITGQNFYVSKHHWKDFRILRNMIREEVSPRYTLLLINFDHRKCSDEEIVHVPKMCADGTYDPAQDDCTYCRRPNDVYLPTYLEKARNLLESRGLCDDPANPSVINIAKISDRARILAEVVSEEMCGTRPGTQDQVCTDQMVLNHLNYLKCMLHCNIIPLGQIRYGGFFERAVLFKTLADKTGLPCTLQRGEDGRTLWNEIPLPALDLDESRSVLPTRLLRPTHLVDLMDSPGALYPLQSREAYQYIRLL